MIDVDYHGAVARLSLNRPVARNALRVADWQQLSAAVADVARSGARVLVLRSAVPGTFSAGADLKELATLQADAALRAPFRAAMRGALDAITDLGMPTIALVDGGCFGAGVALAMACDMRLAAPAARFAIPPAKLGILYPVEDVNRLTDLVGTSQAILLLASGRAIDAAEAARIGLVDRVEPDVAAAAEALAAEIAANAPASVRLLKRMVTDFYPFIERDEEPRLGDRLFDDAFGGDAFAEGMAAYGQKRAPVFEG